MDYKTLRTKKMVVRPILGRDAWLRHGSVGSKKEEHSFDGTNVNFFAKQSKSGLLEDVLEELSQDERKALAEEIRIKPEEFSIFQPDNYFTKHMVSVNKNQKTINCKNPIELLDYLILKKYTNLFKVPGGPEMPAQRFEIVDQEAEVVQEAQKVDLKMKAILELSKYNGSVDKLKNILLVSGVQGIPANASADWLFTECYKIAEKTPKDFLKVMSDPMFDLKILINNALNVKAIVKTGKDSYEMSSTGKILGSMKEVVAYFEKPENQEDRLIVQAQINKTK
jgi:hypothetical protein